MIYIKNKIAIEKMAVAGKILAEMLVDLNEIIKPDISTLDIDTWIDKKLQQNKLVSKTKGFSSYKHASCVSVNDEIVHGVPNALKKLK